MVDEALFKANEKLIHQVINDLKYIPKKAEREDILQVGRIALWKSINSYDECEGYALSTHCYKGIYRDIVHFLEKVQRIKRKDIYVEQEETFTDGIEDEIVGNLIVNEMMKHLSEQDVEIFIDKHVNKFTYPELIDKFGLSRSTLIRKVEHAKEVLQNNMKWER